MAFMIDVMLIATIVLLLIVLWLVFTRGFIAHG
jgi:hypothetical protein